MEVKTVRAKIKFSGEKEKASLSHTGRTAAPVLVFPGTTVKLAGVLVEANSRRDRGPQHAPRKGDKLQLQPAGYQQPHSRWARARRQADLLLCWADHFVRRRTLARLHQLLSTGLLRGEQRLPRRHITSDRAWHQGPEYFIGCSCSAVCEGSGVGQITFPVNDSHYDDNQSFFDVTIRSRS